MSAPIASTVEPPRVLRAASVPPAPDAAPDRRVSRAERRRTRRNRRLVAFLGLGVLCLFLIATVLVLDSVR